MDKDCTVSYDVVIRGEPYISVEICGFKTKLPLSNLGLSYDKAVMESYYDGTSYLTSTSEPLNIYHAEIKLFSFTGEVTKEQLNDFSKSSYNKNSVLKHLKNLRNVDIKETDDWYEFKSQKIFPNLFVKIGQWPVELTQLELLIEANIWPTEYE